MVSRRTRVFSHLSAGGVLVIASVLTDDIMARPREWGFMQSLALMIGLGIVAIGVVPRHAGILSRGSTGLCLSLLILVVLLAAGEVFFRRIGFDFAAGKRSAWRQQPIFFRHPTDPTGTVFFKRPGPEQWTGQVLNARFKHLGASPNPHAHEPVLTIQYDHRGFRNPDHMSDWGIAVAGDSFTEAGYLAHERLFTSILARTLDVGVLNLGVSNTGPLTQLSYLEDFGIAASTRHAIIVFFEGNDLENLAAEYDAVVRWRETGQRGTREIRKQPSLVCALNELVVRALHEGWRRSRCSTSGSDWIHAYFKSSRGDIPVRLRYAPPGRAQLSRETIRRLDYFFRRYAEFREDRHVTTWLAYMPCKERVLHGRIDFSANATGQMRDWQPTDLPEVISGLCDQHGIKFIDLTPALIGETCRGEQLLYNAMDTHLNAQGSLLVGQELARHVSGQDPSDDSNR